MRLAFVKKFSVSRTISAGRYDADGFYQPGESKEFTIMASLQPLKERDRILLPEGSRLKEAFTIYTDTKLTVGNEKDQSRADVVLVNGEKFEVIGVSDYAEHLNLKHFKCTIVRDNRNDGRDDLHSPKGAS